MAIFLQHLYYFITNRMSLSLFSQASFYFLQQVHQKTKVIKQALTVQILANVAGGYWRRDVWAKYCASLNSFDREGNFHIVNDCFLMIFHN